LLRLARSWSTES
jgi:4-carboxymuconolactone decarboxylase